MEILSLDIDVSITTENILCPGGGNFKGEGSADCKKLCTGGIVGGELSGGGKCRLQETLQFGYDGRFI